MVAPCVDLFWVVLVLKRTGGWQRCEQYALNNFRRTLDAVLSWRLTFAVITAGLWLYVESWTLSHERTHWPSHHKGRPHCNIVKLQPVRMRPVTGLDFTIHSHRPAMIMKKVHFSKWNKNYLRSLATTAGAWHMTFAGEVTKSVLVMTSDLSGSRRPPDASTSKTGEGVWCLTCLTWD